MTPIKRIASVLIIAAAVSPLFAGFKDQMYQADLLDIEGKYAAEEDLLNAVLKKSADNAQYAEIYWRLSRTYMQYGEERKLANHPRDELLALFERGIQYADMALEKDPTSAMSYFWKAANDGMWGQVKGIIESLQMASEMKDLLFTAISYDPLYPGSYYVLGQLYDQVPGWPLSFGNTDFAVSLARRAVAVNELNMKNGTYPYKYYDMYVELANYLWKRNWDEKRRLREQQGKRKTYGEKSATLEKYCYYEGVVELKPVSDRREAMQIIRESVTELERISPRLPFQEKALVKARKLLADWK